MLPSLDIWGIRIIPYDVMNTIFVQATYIFILLQAKSYRLYCPHAIKMLMIDSKGAKKKSTYLVLAELFAIALTFQALMMIFNKMFGLWLTNGNANYYGSLFAWSVVMSLLPYGFFAPPLRTSDLLTPVLPLGLAISKIGCFFAGCCSSFEMSSFYYNHQTERYEFPIQLLEAIIAFVIFLYTLKLRRKLKRPGFLFPIYTILYAVCRFITEFLRADSNKTVYFLNNYQLISIIAIIIGLFLLIMIDTFGEKIEEYSNRRFNHVITQSTKAAHEKQE